MTDIAEARVRLVEAQARLEAAENRRESLRERAGELSDSAADVEAEALRLQEEEQEIAAEIRPLLEEIPGARANISSPNSLSIRTSGQDFEFAVTGPTYEGIAAAADALIVAMEERMPGVSDPVMSYSTTQPELSIQIDRERASDLGVDVDGIAATLRAMVDGAEVAELNVGDESVPVWIESSFGAVDDTDDLNNLYVSTADGRIVPLSSIITIREGGAATELEREGQRRAIEIDADIAPGHTLSEAINAVRALAADNLTGDVGLIFLGEAKELNETSHDLAVTYLIAFVVVFLVLVAQFESLTSAVVVMLTVPFGICAAIFALFMTGTSINIYSQIGVLMLTGIMAKNAILMVEFADQLRERGMTPFEAAREASLVRFRPIMMTMVSTVAGGLPLILGTGPGAEARVAIGWVIFGGLAMAAAITLLLTLVLYSRIAGLSKPRTQTGQELADELREVSNRTASNQPAE